MITTTQQKYTPTQADRNFMQRAIALSIENVANGGGPFGAVIVKDNAIVAEGVNRVTANNDPTAHAEVLAIRDACAALGRFKLEDCVIYASCEPCPMCLSAIYWAGIRKIFYANTKKDAADIDFDDSFIYEEIAKPYAARKVKSVNMLRAEALKAFDAWRDKTDKVEY